MSRLKMSGAVGLAALAWSVSPALAQRGATEEIAKAFAECRAVADGEARLGCYDGLAARIVPPRFSGRLTVTTEPFAVDRPTLIRFQSDGPIFVMYLRDAQENVVQNLHIGGGGEAVHLIENPGTYSLRINGSETWRVWLEPQSSRTTAPAR